MAEYFKPYENIKTPSLYSLDPDLFAEADRQTWEWEARETGVMPRYPQIIKSETQEGKPE